MFPAVDCQMDDSTGGIAIAEQYLAVLIEQRAAESDALPCYRGSCDSGNLQFGGG